MSRLGHNRERQVKAALESDDWFVTRAAGSLGDADLVALRAGSPPRLVEVKATAQGPWEHFGPAQRADLRYAARVAGAEAWVCWWPSRGKAVWIHENHWPAEKAAA